MTTLKEFQAAAKEKDQQWFPALGGYVMSFDQSNKRNYFAGNSLGLKPAGFDEKLHKHSTIWQNEQHDGHFAVDGTEKDRPWWRYQEKFVPRGSKLTGAVEDVSCPEIAFMNTLSVNTRCTLETFCMYHRDHMPNRHIIPVIITVKINFPSDDVGLKYALNVVYGKTNYQLIEIEPATDGLHHFDKLIATIKSTPNIAMGFFPGLCYITGQRFPIKEITEALHSVGAIAGFDLAHSVGNYQLHLHDDGVDFATFCGYKYLAGGPGCTGGIFVHQRWFSVPDFDAVSGWFGIHPDDRFNFDPDSYRPALGAWRFLQSNDQIFNMLGLEASFDLIDKYGQENIFKKNEEISTFMYECLKCIPEVAIITPALFSLRGCQILFRVPSKDVKEIYEQVCVHSFCERRGKDTIRVAPFAYNTFFQTWDFCNYLKDVIAV